MRIVVSRDRDRSESRAEADRADQCSDEQEAEDVAHVQRDVAVLVPNDVAMRSAVLGGLELQLDLLRLHSVACLLSVLDIRVLCELVLLVVRLDALVVPVS